MVRYPPSSVRVPIIMGGIGLAGAAYLAGMIAGFGYPDVPGADALKVPVVGPWVALGQSGCSPDQTDCTAMLVVRTILTALDGVAQLGGLGLVAEGIFMTTEADAPEGTEPAAGATAAARSRHAAALRVEVAPVVSPQRATLGVVGRF